VVFLVFGCSYEDRGLEKLKRLCKRDAGLALYASVVVDGFYDSTGNTNLVESQYKFVEICDPDFRYADPDASEQCYRLKKVNRGSALCNEVLDRRLSKFSVPPYPEFLKTQCIAVEPISKPSAAYRYEVERKEWWVDKERGAKMTHSIAQVSETTNNKVLARRISYGLYPEGYGTPQSRPHIGCGSYKVTGKSRSEVFAPGMIEKTLIAKGTEKSITD
jgi:hypothetical protein